MKNCFGYTRVSTVKQGEGVSLEAQKDAIIAFASRNNITIIKWWEEKETAAKKGRPLFNKMVSDLRRGKAQGLVIHKIDRSARNFSDWAKIGEMADAGIDIHFATESLDFRSRGGRLTADIQAVIAADYVRNLREECIKGMNGRLKQGLYPFKAPIGYLDNGGGQPKTPDPERAQHIQDAFELYGSNQYSQLALQGVMERRGLRTKEGRPLSLTGLENMLNNPFYCGIIKIKRSGAVFPGVHEPLISVSLFERVQAIKAGKAVKKITKHNHTYRRLFRCALCDGAMIPERQKGRVYYRCQGRACPTKTVREDAMEAAILRCLNTMHLTDQQIERLTDKVTKWLSNPDADAKRKAIPIQLSAIAEKQERLTDALIDKLIDRDTYNSRREALLREQMRLKEEAQKMDCQRSNPQQVREFLELIKNLAYTYLFAAPAEKYRIVEIATSNRKVELKNICLEPSKWLLDVGQAIAAHSGAPSPCADRNMMDTLYGLLKHSDVIELQDTLRANKPSGRFSDMPKTTASNGERTSADRTLPII